jgi:hypothetical protein
MLQHHTAITRGTLKPANTSSMNEPKTDALVSEKTSGMVRSEEASEVKQPASGMEINLGDFTRTQGLMKSLRLMLDNQIVIPVEEIAGGVGEAGRKFKMGDLEQANQDVARLYATFGQKTSQWESRARSLEQQRRLQISKNPKSISIDTMNRMKTEQVAVRTRIATAEVHFRRLHQGLDQAYTNLQCQPVPRRSPSFLARFMAAPLADRLGLVKERFESITPLEVTIKRSQTGGYEIQFAPRPPRGSLLFLTTIGEIVRLHELGAQVVVEDLETGSKSEMKVASFVKLVQAGVWLLQPADSA